MHPGIHAPHDPHPKGRGARARRGRVCSVLVRGAMLFSALPILTSCLVDEPPEFEDPELTAPIIDWTATVPTNTKFLPMSSGTRQDFTVMLQSEDGGEELVAIPWINFGLVGQRALPAQGISAGNFSTPRPAPLVILLDSTVPKGCVPLTIQFAHKNDVDFLTDDGYPRPIAGAPVSQGTWWLLVDALPEDVSIADCPQALLSGTGGAGQL